MIEEGVKSYITDKRALEKLNDYLSRHEVVGAEIFSYLGTEYAKWGEDYLMTPIPKSLFLRRLPFYFYQSNSEKSAYMNLAFYTGGIYSYCNSSLEKDYAELAERLFGAFERIHYDFHLDVESIFEYPTTQVNNGTYVDFIFQWDDYLQLTRKFGIIDHSPNNFIVVYNSLLERDGRPPIVYEINEQFIGEFISRNGSTFFMEGVFPCDKEGHPIMQWIGVRIKNSLKIWAKVNNKFKGTLYVEATPKTLIWGLNCWGQNDDGSDAWYQLYTGPQLIEFDYESLKYARKREKLTQQQVADAIGASVRTYQKWESGDTTPDCRYLLRLMNVLDVKEVSELTQVIEI